MQNEMNPVVHFEMPYEDKQRVADFYQKTFGWKPQMLGPEMGEYVVVHTSEIDEHNMVKEGGRINGGLFKKTKPEQGTNVVIAVPDIKAAMQRVTENGGKLLGAGPDGGMEPAEIPGVGLFMTFSDSEGNRVSMLEPKGM